MEPVHLEQWKSHGYEALGGILSNLWEYQSPLEMAAALDRLSRELKDHFCGVIEDAIEQGDREDALTPLPSLPDKYDAIPSEDSDLQAVAEKIRQMPSEELKAIIGWVDEIPIYRGVLGDK